MPSPFLRMDPYIEHPTWWGGVHQGMIAYAREALNALLPPAYVADMGERIYDGVEVGDCFSRAMTG